jgi:hypothetical protein
MAVSWSCPSPPSTEGGDGPSGAGGEHVLGGTGGEVRGLATGRCGSALGDDREEVGTARDVVDEVALFP